MLDSQHCFLASTKAHNTTGRIEYDDCSENHAAFSHGLDLDLEGRSLDIRGGRGSDLISVAGRAGPFSGGLGDDFMTAAGGSDQTLDGGFGNDNIRADRASGGRLFGGMGDDNLNMQHDVDSEESSIADGGNGDDTLFAQISTLDGAAQSHSVLRGGAGDDEFGLRVRTNDGAYLEAAQIGALDQTNEAGDPVVNSGIMAQIEDFRPGADVLNIDIRGFNDEGSFHDYRGFELTQWDGGTDIDLIFDGLRPDANGTYELISTIRLDGVTGLTVDDINIEAGDPGMVGTPGDDVIEVIAATAPARIMAGDGDDNVTFIGSGDTSLEGGAGDDTLTSTGDGNTLISGPGNDVLAGGPASMMMGGDGDDQVTLDLNRGPNDTAGLAYGNAGDDTLIGLGQMGSGFPDGGYGALFGGPGADTFDVTLELVSRENGNSTGTQFVSTGLSVGDFNPDEDVLTIQIDRAAGGEEREMTSAEIGTSRFGMTQLVMRFAATATDPATEATMLLGDNANITLDDIAFIQA